MNVIFIVKTFMNKNISNSVKSHWSSIQKRIDDCIPYDPQMTRKLLLKNDRYKRYIGKAKNRTLIAEDLKLYASIMVHSQELESVFKAQQSYKGHYNFPARMKFIVECNYDIEQLRCECGRKYNWTKYCRQCPSPKRTFIGRNHTEETKRKQRISTLEYLESCKGQLAPRYNKDSISIIEDYGKKHGYKFMHAENGGEYFVKGLGYFIDAYDPINNVALEIDERHHFNNDGSLKERDIIRQQQIQKVLDCEFYRVKFIR